MDYSQTTSNVSRIWILDDGIIRCIGKDTGWNRWTVKPNDPSYQEFLELLKSADRSGWIK